MNALTLKRMHAWQALRASALMSILGTRHGRSEGIQPLRFAESEAVEATPILFAHTEPSALCITAGTLVLFAAGFAIRHLLRSREELKARLSAIESELEAARRESEKRREELRRRITAQAAALHQANRANKAKSSFLAAMSHEIRTPMNAVLNMCQLALDSDIPPKVQRYLKVAHSSGNSLLHLINDILDFSKIEADKVELEEISFSVQTVIDEISNSFRAKTYDKKLEFVAGAGHGVPPQVNGDPLRIRQVLLNLVGNAFKFTDRGEVVLEARVIRRQDDEHDSARSTIWLRFSVRDTGIGIPKDQQAKLFDAFSQVGNSTPRKYGGSGLGLAISQKLVQLMGGRLEIESEEGTGTEFFFTLPFQYDSQLADIEYDTSLFLSQRARIVVVEDNPVTAEVVGGMLKRFGMDHDHFDTAEAALEHLNKEPAPDGRLPSVILMDWLLPGMDGIEAVRKIRDNPALADIPILMTSAFAAATHEDQARDAGANGFMHKPITASDLFDHIIEQIGPLPYEREKRPAGFTDIHERVSDLKGARILLAEDNAANQFVIEEIFNDLGIQLTIANNGLEALEKLEADSTFDCVLMDMQMPEMDGLAAAREIRDRWPDLNLPIVALTANAMKRDRDLCTQAGMDDFVSKPIDISQLVEVLVKWTPNRARTRASSADH